MTTTGVTVTANRTEGEITVTVSGTGSNSGYTFNASGTTHGNVVFSGDVLTGGAGDDALVGAVQLVGGPGDDALSIPAVTQGTIPIIVDGGEGSRDSLSFGAVAVPATISLDGAANDTFATTPNARPLTITGIEDVTGGLGNDTITGGGGIFDIVRGGLGTDTLNTRGSTPGFTDAACGKGIDNAAVDFIDLVDANCETVDRAAAPPLARDRPGRRGSPGSPGGPGGDPAAPILTIDGVPASLARGKALKGVTVTVATSERARIVGELLGTATGARLKAVTNNLVLARKTLPLGTGTRSMLLKPPAKLMAGARTRSVGITATDAAGNSRTTTRRIRIR